MPDRDYEAALQAAVAAIEDPGRWGPLLAMARRVGRCEEAARALLEALPEGLARAPLELELIRALAEAEVCLGRHWWAVGWDWSNTSTATHDGRHGIDLTDEGVDVRSGPGWLAWRRMAWPPGYRRAPSTQLLPGEHGWFWLLSSYRDDEEPSVLLAFDPEAMAWRVHQDVPPRTFLRDLDREGGHVLLAPDAGRAGPGIRVRLEDLPEPTSPPPPAPAIPDWAEELSPRFGSERLAARELEFTPDGTALVVDRDWQGCWVFDLRTGLPRAIPGGAPDSPRVPLGLRARLGFRQANPEDDGYEALLAWHRREDRVQRLPLHRRPPEPRAVVAPEGTRMFWLETGTRLRALTLEGGQALWDRDLAEECPWLLSGSGAVAALDVPRGGATVFDAATGEVLWEGELPERSRPGHAGGVTRAGLLARRPDGAVLLRSRDSLTWLLPDGGTRLLEDPQPETLGPPREVAVSPDGRLTVRWGEGGVLEAMDPWTGARRAADLRRPPLTGAPPRPHGPLALDASGTRLAYVEGELIRLVRLDDGCLAEVASVFPGEGKNASSS